MKAGASLGPPTLLPQAYLPRRTRRRTTLLARPRVPPRMGRDWGEKDPEIPEGLLAWDWHDLSVGERGDAEESWRSMYSDQLLPTQHLTG